MDVEELPVEERPRVEGKGGAVLVPRGPCAVGIEVDLFLLVAVVRARRTMLFWAVWAVLPAATATSVKVARLPEVPV